MMETYDLSIKKLNEEGSEYLKEIFDTGEDLEQFLLEAQDIEIKILEDEEPDDSSREFLDLLENISRENYGISLLYVYDDDEITLDIDRLNVEGHEYLKTLFNLPDYYGNNLDALYDCLSELDDTNVRIINLADVNEFSLGVLSVMDDVADEYGNLKTSYEIDEELIDD